MPVSNTSALGVRSTNSGGSRWIGRRWSAIDRAAVVDRLAQQVEDAAQRFLADRNGQRRRRCRRTSIPRRRPSVDPSATARTRPPPRCCCTSPTRWIDEAVVIGIDLDGVVDAGELCFGKLGVEGRADHLGDLSGGGHDASLVVLWIARTGRRRRETASPAAGRSGLYRRFTMSQGGRARACHRNRRGGNAGKKLLLSQGGGLREKRYNPCGGSAVGGKCPAGARVPHGFSPVSATAPFRKTVRPDILDLGLPPHYAAPKILCRTRRNRFRRRRDGFER